MTEPQVIYCVVGNCQTNQVSYEWRAWWMGDSGYLKATAPDSIAGFKLSMHPPNTRHTAWGFRLAEDHEAAEQARKAGGIVIPSRGGLPMTFPGHRVSAGIWHVARIRTDWSMFRAGWPLGPPITRTVKTSRLAAVAPWPGIGKAADLDLYLSIGSPYWPEEQKARADNAALGPLTGRTGHHLTGVLYLRSTVDHPHPVDDLDHQPHSVDHANRPSLQPCRRPGAAPTSHRAPAGRAR